jgi:hypothetical protein
VSTAGVDTVATNNTDDDVILVIAAAAQPSRRPTSRGGSLPATGAAITGLLAVGTVLVASGGGLRATGRRIRRRR